MVELNLGHYLEITDLSKNKRHRAFVCVDVDCFHLAIIIKRFNVFIVEYYKIPNNKHIETLFIDDKSIKYLYSKKGKHTDQVQAYSSEEEALNQINF